MNDGNTWVMSLISAAAGIVAGILGMLATLKGAGVNAQAVEYGALIRRLSEVEARADQMGETIYRKDRQLIDALEEAADAKSAAERAEHRAAILESRCRKLELAFDEFLTRTRMPATERERLRVIFTTN